MEPRHLLITAVLLTLTVATGACEREGPAERAGQRIDEAVSEASDEIEDAGERVSEALEDAEDELEEER